MRPIPPVAIELIKSWEGIEDGDPRTVNLDPYMDPIGIWTIGWGHAISKNGVFLKGKKDQAKAYAQFPGGITMLEAERLLQADVIPRALAVERLVTTSINDNQYAALVSLAFNIGTGNLAESKLLKYVNMKRFDTAAAAFMSWVMAGGKKSKGLENRRREEKALFLRKN